jgi:hypothetical protein
MKLIIIHGPPAAGKYTVGKVLADVSGFRLFHNHLSIDCVKPVLDFGTDAFWRLNVKIRCDVIAEAAKANVSVIHTLCYAKGTEDDQFFADIIAAAEDNSGEVYLVLLTCSDDERRRRIQDESRAVLGKLTDPGAVPSRVNLDATYDGRETLVVDNTSLSPKETADRIIEHFGLDPLKKRGYLKP